MGHAARLSSPSGRCSLWACGPGFFALRASCLRRGTFCSPKKFHKKCSLRWPCGASRITSDPLRSFPQLACIGGGRGGAALKLVAHQPCHLWPPRNIRLTCNPLGAFLFRAHQRGSRDAVRNLGRVSSSFWGQPRVFDNISSCPPGGFL